MGLFTGLLVYLVIWWLVLFMVLPWGVRQPQQTPPGHDPGAPVRPRIGLRFGVTTLISAVLWLIVYMVMEMHLVTIEGA